MALGAIFLFLWEYNTKLHEGATYALQEAQTMGVTTLILFQLFYLFNCRGKCRFFSNPSIFIGVASVLLGQIAFVYLPFMRAVFHSTSLDLKSWLLSTTVAFSIIPLTLLENLFRLRKE